MKYRYFIWILFSVGILLRLWQYLVNRSLWLDESSVSYLILQRPLSDILTPLGHALSAPIGFVFITKLATLLFGQSEYVLRLSPLIAGIGSVLLFYFLVTYLFKKNTLVLIITSVFFVLSRYLIYYSSEVKQYSLDVFFSLLCFVIFSPILEQKKLDTKNITLIIITGILASWFSQPVIFILASWGLIVIWRSFWERNILTKVAGFSIVFVWGFSFIVNYFVTIIPAQSDRGLVFFWKEYFLPNPMLVDDNLTIFISKIYLFFNNPLDFQVSLLAVIFFIVGSVSLIQNNFKLSILFISPIFFTVIASVFGQYPFGGKFLLFLIPNSLIVIGFGVKKLFDTKNSLIIAGTAICISLLVVLQILRVSQQIIYPKTNEDTRSVIKYLKNKMQKDDILYVYYASRYPYLYYSLRYNLEGPHIFGIERTLNVENYRRDLDKLVGKKRVWILLSHVVSNGEVNEREVYIQYLDKVGQRLDHFFSPGAYLYLYDLTTK